MAETLKLPFRAPARGKRDENQLARRIKQINDQKGAFHKVTETSLIEEINSVSDNGKNLNMYNGRDDDHDDEGAAENIQKKRQELIWKGREEMLQRLM